MHLNFLMVFHSKHFVQHIFFFHVLYFPFGELLVKADPDNKETLSLV